MVAFSFAPSQWALCNGQTIAISQNQALFALLGTTYGGNGTTAFQLPDLRSRSPVHPGQGPGLSSILLGQFAGVEQVSIAISNMPTHTHVATFTPSGGGGTPTVNVSIAAGNDAAAATTPSTRYLAATTPTPRTGAATPLYAATAGTGTPATLQGVTATLSGVGGGGGTVTNATTGQSLPLPTRNPYLGINFIIALYGIFPSRN
jgi:microcystin-dependent protein